MSSSDTIYFPDLSYGRVRKISGAIITTFVGSGCGFNGDGLWPLYIAFDDPVVFDCCAARKLMCLVHPRPCPRGQQPIAHLYMPRGLIFKMARAMSLLLHPCTSRRNTCWSRGVILISLRLITGFSSAPSVQSWGRDPPKQKQAVRQMFADQQRHLEPYSYTATCSLRAPSLTSFS